MSRSEELEQLIAEQQAEMRKGHREWPEFGAVSLDAIGLFLDENGHSARAAQRTGEGGFGGRIGDHKLWKLKTGDYTPFRGCRKHPKEHGQRYMVEAGGQRRCGKCYDDYNRARTPGFGTGRGGKRAPRPKCGHPESRQKQRYRNGKKNGTQCLDCMMEKARERRRNG